MGIYAGTIDNNLKGISLRVQNDITITGNELNEIIRLISFETKKILNVVAFATKANFKLKTEKITVDLNDYIREYIQNIIPTITDQDLKISLRTTTVEQFNRKIKPIELNIVLDNIINNSKKAKANHIEIELFSNNNKLMVTFTDDGVGLDETSIDRIYDFGFTTTDGAGLGLYHVKQIISSMRGSIKAANLRRIAQIARAQNITLVWLTQPTLWHKGMSESEKRSVAFATPVKNGKSYANGLVAEGMLSFNQRLIDIAEEEGVILIDLAAKLPKDQSMLFDNCHYTKAGAREVAKIIYNELEGFLTTLNELDTPLSQ